MCAQDLKKILSVFLTFKIIGFVKYRRQNTLMRDMNLSKRIPTDQQTMLHILHIFLLPENIRGSI